MNPDTLLRSTRPEPGRAWAGTPEGRAVLDGILAHDVVPARPRRLRRPLIVAGAGAAVLAASGAFAWVKLAEPVPPTWTPPPPSVGVACAKPGRMDMAVVHQNPGESPVDACRRRWTDAFQEPAPATLYGCVMKIQTPVTPGTGPQAGEPAGAVFVFPGHGTAAETCGAEDMFVAPGN
jgi:hypothetical protein